MSDQDRRAKAEWTQYEAAGRDLSRRAEVLGLRREELAAEIEPLELAVEDGCLEYKRGLLTGAFRALGEARYRSLSGAAMLGVAQRFAVYTYVATIQRLMADGVIAVRDHAPRDGAQAASPPQIDVKTIMADIRDRVRADPALKTRQPVKAILMQLARYSRELEQFRELASRAPADKREAIGESFRRATGEISASIRRNYEQLLAGERGTEITRPQNILLRVPVKEASALFLKQAQAAMDVRSRLLYARDEQYQWRELLVELAGRHDAMLAMLDEERFTYLRIAGTARLADELTRTFAVELRRRIERETDVY